MKYIDMHCDTISRILISEQLGHRISFEHNDLMIDLEKLEKGDCLCQNLAFFVHLGMPKDLKKVLSASPNVSESTSKNTSESVSESEGTMIKTVDSVSDSDDEDVTAHIGQSRPLPPDTELIDPWENVCEQVRVFREVVSACPDRISQVTNGEQIRANAAAGRVSALMTVEEGGVCKGSVKHLEELYDQGVRMMTLTWNIENELASPNHFTAEHYFDYMQGDEGGLKPLGFEFVQRMQELGMLVDVSHLSDAGFWNVAGAVKGPFVASHSNARALCGCSRNLTDDMIRTLAEHGGVVGLNFGPEFLHPQKVGPRQTVERIAAHARHIINVGGIGCVGLGSDFDGIDGHMEIGRADQMPMLAEGLERLGFTLDEVEHIFYKNVLRVYDDVLG